MDFPDIIPRDPGRVFDSHMHVVVEIRAGVFWLQQSCRHVGNPCDIADIDAPVVIEVTFQINGDIF